MPRETRFTQIGAHIGQPLPGMRKAEQMFLTMPALSHTDIQEMGRLIAQDILSIQNQKNPTGAATNVAQRLGDFFAKITHLLLQRHPLEKPPATHADPVIVAPLANITSEDIATHVAPAGFTPHPENRFRFADSDGVTLEYKEVEDALDRVRQAVAEELHSALPDMELYVRGRDITGYGHVHHTSGERILKTPPLYSEKFRDANVQALNTLYTMPERSPHLLYPVFAHDANWSVQIQRHINFTTLEEYTSRKPLPPLQHTIRFLHDAFSGMHFLYTHGLLLEDIKLRNVAVDEEHQLGALFDFDQLYGLKGAELEDGSAVQQHMVQELGEDIGPILRAYRDELGDTAEVLQLQEAYSQLMSRNVNNHPTITLAIELLTPKSATR